MRKTKEMSAARRRMSIQTTRRTNTHNTTIRDGQLTAREGKTTTTTQDRVPSSTDTASTHRTLRLQISGQSVCVRFYIHNITHANNARNHHALGTTKHAHIFDVGGGGGNNLLDWRRWVTSGLARPAAAHGTTRKHND